MMARQSGKSAFDDLLASFSEADRQVATDLAGRYPQLSESVMLRSDYSRSLDAVKDKVDLADRWVQWQSEHWDDANQMTKAEYALSQERERLKTEKRDLEERLALGMGDEMDLAELDRYLTGKGFVDTKVIQGKEQEFMQYVDRRTDAFSAIAAEVPYLNQKHHLEFGELFDPLEFLKDANAKGATNLRDFYETSFVLNKRQDKTRQTHEAEIAKLRSEKDSEIAAAKAEAERMAEAVRGMGPGAGPSDMEGPAMGSVQRAVLGVDKSDVDSQMPNVPMGEGGLANAYAKIYRQNQLTK